MKNTPDSLKEWHLHPRWGSAISIFFLLILTKNVIQAQNAVQIDWKDFYPLHINDFWKYEENWSMMGIKIIETKKVIGYETVQNGREYAKIQGIDYTFHKTDYIHQRVDSAGNVFVYYPNINTENLLYKFNVCVGDTWPNQAGVMWRVEEKSILDNKIYFTFRLMSSMPFSTCSITEGIGLVGYSYEGGGAGLVGYCINGIVKGDTTTNTAVDDIMEIKPRESLLEQNYPNPFNPSTEITYKLHEKVRVKIEIYSPAGRKIRTLVDRDRPAGEYTVVWDGADDADRRVGSGIYVCRMSAGRFVKTIKMAVAR